METILRIEKSRKESGLKVHYTEDRVKELYKDWETVPNDLAPKMLSVRDKWKADSLLLSKDQAWQNVVNMINAMFGYHE